MQTLTEIEIDQLCERFEDDWEIDSAGPTGIAAFLFANGIDSPVDPIIARHFIEVDLERCWMAWGKRIDSLDSDSITDGLAEALRRIPDFTQYASLMADGEVRHSIEADLAHCECRCREQWGDAIGPFHYEKVYGIVLAPNSEISSRQIRCDIDGHREKTAACFPLRGRNTFGRKRSFERVPCCVIEKPEGNRIVIAGFTEATISREHFSLQILNPNRVIVTNHCKINPLRVMGHNDLHFQHEMLLSYPFSIRLPGRVLRFF
ncbi:hypothetical protein SH528x_000077 [Novipirellula sp. SH528]|uniref:hypothetical protein n=1 Tax=Novipirellula sp. SH528 TaxID=3454466 RepID=UPI003F9FCC21